MSIIGIFRLQVDGMMINNITSNYYKQEETWLKGCIPHLLKCTLLPRLLSSGLSFWFWFWFSMSISSQLYIAGKRQMNCKLTSYWNKLLFQLILWFPTRAGTERQQGAEAKEVYNWSDCRGKKLIWSGQELCGCLCGRATDRCSSALHRHRVTPTLSLSKDFSWIRLNQRF